MSQRLRLSHEKVHPIASAADQLEAALFVRALDDLQSNRLNCQIAGELIAAQLLLQRWA